MQGLITLLAASSSGSWGSMFQVPAFLGFSPSESCSRCRARHPFGALCSLALEPFATGQSRETVGTSEPYSRQRACLASPAVTLTTESLLSWGFSPLGPDSSNPADRRRLLFCTFNPCLTTLVRCSRVFLLEERCNLPKKISQPLWCFSPTRLSKPFDTFDNAGLWFHRTKLAVSLR